MANNAGKKTTLICVMLSAFLTPFDGSSINVALPSIGHEFAMDAVSLGWVATAYLVACAMFIIPFGRFADIHGRKRLYRFGVLTFTAASFSMVLCGSGTMLIILRIVQGMGGAMIYGTGMAILTSVFPASERGRVLGITVASTYFGLSIGPFLGGFLTTHFGWRSIFLVNVPLGLAVVGLVSFRMKGEWADARGERFDLAGSVLYCLALVAIMYGFSSFALLPHAVSGTIILAGAVGIAAFIRREMYVRSPLLNVNLFRQNRALALSNLAALINYSATFAVTFFLSLYLQYIKGLTPKLAGLVLVCQPIVMVVGSPFAGRLSDKIEPRIVASIGMAVSAIGMYVLASVNPDTSLQIIMADLIVLGLGFALFSSPNTNAVMSSVDKRFYGVASGTLGTMRLTGQMFSMGIAMLIFAIHIGHTQITPESYPAFMSSMRSAYILFGVLSSVGVFASLARGRVRQG